MKRIEIVCELELRKNRLLSLLDVIILDFNDKLRCKSVYKEFVEEIERMRNEINIYNWYLFRLIIGCIDAAKNNEAENLTIEQLKVLRKNVECMNIFMNEREANSRLNELVMVGMKPTPALESIENID